MSGILRLESLTKGNTLKQGDKTPLKYRLFDADGEKINIAGKSAKVRLVYPDFLTIGYEKDGLTVAQDDTVTFTIDNVIPSRIYHVEIIVDDQFIFPSRADESKFTVDKSSLGAETNIVEIVGVDAVVKKAVGLINDDPSLIIDEGKLVNDIIKNTGIGNIEEYYQQFSDVIKELSKDKDYNSLPEISVARGGFGTLGERLDDTDTQVDTLETRMSDIIQSADLDPNKDQEVVDARLGEPTLALKLGKMTDQLKDAEGSMENLIPNGNFEKDSNGDGLADGLVSTSATYSLVDGTQSFTPTKTYDTLSILNFAGDGVSRYYISALVKSNKNTTQLRINSPTVIAKYHSGSGQYERLSVIGAAASIRITELGADSFSKVDVRNWVAIKLDVFDSEPTIAEMDRLMELHGGYFEGKVPHKLTQKVLVNSLLEQPKLVDSKISDFTDTIISTGGNLYDKVKHFVPHKYSAVNGVLTTATGWGLAQIPVNPESKYSIMLPNLNSYSGVIGSVSFYKGTELLSFIYPASGNINGQYNGKDYITVTTPTGIDSINITVKSTTFDESNSLIVVKGSSITDRTIKKSLVSFYGADVNTPERISEYQGVKWTVVGDSLTEINSRSSKFYHQYIADELGFEVTNMGVGGTGYKRKDDTNNAFYQRILNIPTDTDVVTIFGSFNDLGSGVPIGNADDTGTDTLAGAINTTIDRLLDILPLVPLGIISPTPWHTTYPWDENNQGSQYVAMLESICRRRGLPYLDLYHTSGLRPWEDSYRALVYDKDPVGNGTHPNEIGHGLIAPRVREFIKTLI